MKIVVIGGSGLIGSKLVARLRQAGTMRSPRHLSPAWTRIPARASTEALEGAQVVVDVSNAPDWDDAAVLDFFRRRPATCSLPKRLPVWAITWRSRSSAPTGCRTAGICAGSSRRSSR